jgi:hypothetical protein
VWVVFDAATATGASELFLGRVDSAGARVERLTRDDGAESTFPDLKIADDGHIALSWYDMRDGNDEVYIFVASQSDVRGEIDTRAHRVTMTDGESIGAYLAWNGEEVGLAWSDKSPGVHDIFFQPFDRTGSPIVAEERITRTRTWSLVPAIRSWRTGFALVWTEYEPTSSQIHEGIGEVMLTAVEANLTKS